MSRRDLPDDALSAYLDGECDAEERTRIEARLADDAQWRAELDGIRTVRDALRALSWPEPPTGFVAGPAGEVGGEVVAIDARRTRTRRARRARSVAAVGVAASIAVAFAVATPSSSNDVAPQLATMSDQHASANAASADPISSLAPVGVPVTFSGP